MSLIAASLPMGQEGQITKHQDERLPIAPSLTEIYRQCDTGKAFAAALAEAGYTLANGDKGRLVIVDAEGKIQNIVRQIDGAKKKDIEAKLSDIDLAALPAANDEAARRKTASRERQEDGATPSVTPERTATVSHIAAVALLTPPVASDQADATPPEKALHLERAAAHLQAGEEKPPSAEEQALLDEIGTGRETARGLPRYSAERAQDPPPQSALHTNLQRAACHLHSFVQWVKDAPSEYLRRRRTAGERGQERQHQTRERERQPDHAATIRREREATRQREEESDMER